MTVSQPQSPRSSGEYGWHLRDYAALVVFAACAAVTLIVYDFASSDSQWRIAPPVLALFAMVGIIALRRREKLPRGFIAVSLSLIVVTIIGAVSSSLASDPGFSIIGAAALLCVLLVTVWFTRSGRSA